MTGDMTINPHASCLIMTTEILRSMLYRGSEVVREVAWVIYDEVHYMRDKDRGVVWEESIILLPHKVRFVFLSATIPNAPSFVNWVSKIHYQPCHVVYTDYRPVPLQHYLFPQGSEGLYLVVDEKSKFRQENFQKAMTSLNPTNTDESKVEDKKSKRTLTKNLTNDLLKIVRLIMERALDPCIVFSFSKKDCETFAMQMGKLEFNNEEEKNLVDQVFNNALDSLADEDRELPQIVTILPLLKRGIGIHHGGLLPILKEVIEILFQEGLIKVLFATETFSIGINMPAKTVVFTSTRKFDGKDFRWVTSGEYIQMSGRAGRRGKDDKGIVIQMIDEKMEPDVAKNMIYGASDPLYSSYHIDYNMVLNMLRVEGADPQNLIKASFHQYTQEENAPQLLRKASEIEKEILNMTIENEEIVNEYLSLTSLIIDINKELNSFVMNPTYCLPFLQPGRLLKIEFNQINFGYGIIINRKKLEFNLAKNDKTTGIQINKWIGKVAPGYRNSITPQTDYYLEVMLEVRRVNDKTKIIKEYDAENLLGHLEFESINTPASEKDDIATEMIQVYVGLEAVAGLSSLRINLPKELHKESQKKSLLKAIKEVQRRFTTKKEESPENSSNETEVNVPLLDPIKDFGLTNPEVEKLIERKQELQSRIASDKYNFIRNEPSIVSKYKAKLKLYEEMTQLKQNATDLHSVTMKEDLKQRRKILRQMDYVNSEGVLTMKGRFACEISAGDELVITNMIFNGIFTDLTVEQTVALLSCFVHQESSTNNSGELQLKFRNDMHKPYRQLIEVAKEIAQISIENGLISEEDDYLKGFDGGLIDATYAWASGIKFVDVCKTTDVFEGSIIRSLRRLEELLRQLAAASLAIGNNDLVNKFTQGSEKIRRGIVFASSLYI